MCVYACIYISHFFFSFLSLSLVFTCNSLEDIEEYRAESPRKHTLSQVSPLPLARPVLANSILHYGCLLSHSAQLGTPCVFPEIPLNTAVQNRAWDLAGGCKPILLLLLGTRGWRSPGHHRTTGKGKSQCPLRNNTRSTGLPL